MSGKYSLKDKVVFITGASSGFGADAGRAFAREGARVVLAARRIDRLNALAEEIRRAGGEALPIQLDVTEREQMEGAVREVLEKWGRIDILINNAGLGRMNWLEKLNPVEHIDASIDINLRAAIHLTRLVLPSMLARGEGHIINMSSVAGLIASPMYSVYAATKFGLRGFTIALRRELTALGIHVSGIYPGPATTNLGKHSDHNPIRENLKIPAWINMTSSYVARKLVWLACHPRRMLVLPWWFVPLVWLDGLFPGLVDWLVKVIYVKRFHKVG